MRVCVCVCLVHFIVRQQIQKIPLFATSLQYPMLSYSSSSNCRLSILYLFVYLFVYTTIAMEPQDSKDSQDGGGKVCFVLIHGLHGSASELHFLRDCIQQRFGDDAVVMIPTCNEGRFLTHDGIENGAKRITQYVKIELKKHRDVRRLSIIGHS